MSHQYNWDLDSLLQNKSLDNLHNQWLNCQKQIINLYDSFINSFKNFKNYLDLGEKYAILSNRLFNYIHNNLNEDVINPKWISWSQKISNEANELSTRLSDYEIRVIKNKKIIQDYLKNDSVKQHQRAFDLIFKSKPHILSEKEEKLLSKIDIYTDGFETIFNTLTDSEIKFDDATNSKNKKIPLKTISDVMINIKAKDRKLRQTTWISFNHSYSKFESTLTQTLYHNYLMFNTHAKIHNFKDYIHSTTFSDEINVNLIENLYIETKKFKPLFQQYRDITNRLLKKQLHLTKLEPWDRTVDLIKYDLKYSIDEAKEIAINSFKPLGEDYVKNVERAFKENWISWLAKPNKQTGAYSISGIKGLNKYYISMNYDKTFNSLKTLVHELGHSLNSHYVNVHQKIYTSIPIFYAEISSITNEMLLSYYLLKKHANNKALKIMLYDELLNNFFNTTTRQIIFSNFEYLANEWVNKNEPFTKEKIKQTYKELISEYQGISKHELKKYDEQPYSYSLSTILRIGHFYVGNFYVYKYAIGQIVATLIAKRIVDGDKTMIERYFKFLSSGSSKNPIDTIKLLGIDLYDQNTYHQVFAIVKQWIDEFKKIS